MAVDAIIREGQIMETAAQTSAKSKTEAGKAPQGYDKDAFLQLLVAQMKYQDPMEPTSNTEYIAQYATFSQVEQLQNMAGSMNLSRASSMVGQTVEISTEDAKGNAKIVDGKVDFVKYENGKAFVSVNGDLYSVDDVTAVIDGTYNSAIELASTFANAMNKLPSLQDLSLADEQTVKDLVEGYNALNAYQQSFIDSSYADLLEQYANRMAALVEERDGDAKAEEESQKATEQKEIDEEVNPVDEVEEA